MPDIICATSGTNLKILSQHIEIWVAEVEKKCNFAAANGSVAQLDRATAF